MATENKEGYVDLYVPKSYANDDPNLVIGINGKNYVLPRGKTTKVPRAVKTEFERSLRAQEKYDKNSAELLEKTKAPIN